VAGQIPRAFIDELLSRIDIVDVVEQYVPLKKAGQDYTALCPFHDERSPSFTVSQKKQFYYCFGCGASGSAINFLMQHGRLEFPEAIEELAARAGVEVPREGGERRPSRDFTALYDRLTAAQHYYSRELRRHERAVTYLKHRGVSGEIAAAFDIGYAPAGWDNLLAALGTDAPARRQLEQAGLLIARGDGHYDRFRDRVMFPIHDHRGRVVGFGGRVLGDEEPKYLNSPETPVFHKSRELYGLYRARRECRDLQRLLVVEGYMDVLGLAQYGVDNAVATLGTATTAEHLERLFRIVPEVVFCFDGDAAGRRAAWRALEQALGLLRDGRSVGFLFLPAGEDPDSLVRREGPAGFTDPARVTPLSTFLFDELTAQTETTSPEGRSRLVALARPLLGRIPRGPYQELLLAHLAELVQMDQGQLRGELGAGSRRPGAAGRPAQRGPGRSLSLVAKTIQALLHQPELAAGVPDPGALRKLPQAGAGLLCDLIDYVQANPGVTTGQLLEHWRDSEHGRHLAQLAARETAVPPDALAPEFEAGLERLLEALGRSDMDALVTNRRPSELSEGDKAALRARIARRKPGSGA